MKTDPFQSCGHCWVFQICWHIEGSIFTASSFQILKSSAEPSPPLALFIMMFPKAHLLSHFKMSGSRWMITPSWLSGLLVLMWDTREAQEYWSHYPSPSPGCLPDPGIKLGPLHWRQIIFLFFLFFNWRITALQNSVVFCQTLTCRWILYQPSYQDLCSKLLLPTRYHLNPLGSAPGLIWVWAHSVQKPQVDH